MAHALRWSRDLIVLLVCLDLGTSSSAEEPVASAAGDFAARLSHASAAMEYWDVTARLETGHRLFLRYLITNQGPGNRTGAAAGNLLLRSGEVVPIQFGRASGGWELTPDGRRLKIASAVLDLRTPSSRLEIDSDKYGIKIHLDFERAAAIGLAPLPGAYEVEATTPAATRGTVWLKGMAAAVEVTGWLTVTHTWMERNEADLLRRRAELVATAGDTALYLLEVTPAAGQARAFVLTRRGDALPRQVEDVAATLASPVAASPYPLPSSWVARGDLGGFEVVARVRRELLRWDPLDVIPRPFRFFLGFSAEPQSLWADADVEMRMAQNAATPVVRTGSGIALVAYAGPWSSR